MKRLRCAFGFLTRFPAGDRGQDAQEDFSGSVMPYFLPALAVGLVGVAAHWAVALLRVPFLAVLGYAMAEMLATGALHLDGFADVCDAFLCSASVEKRLDIMRDSRLGMFGVAGVAFDIGSKILLIGSLSPDIATWSILAALPVLGKVSLIACATRSRAARADGLGHAFLSEKRVGVCLPAMLLCCVLATVVIGWPLGAVCGLAAVVAGLAMGRGYEGDTGPHGRRAGRQQRAGRDHVPRCVFRRLLGDGPNANVAFACCGRGGRRSVLPSGFRWDASVQAV